MYVVLPKMTRYGEIYYITFTDVFSRFFYVYLMKHKLEAYENFKLFQSEVENQLNKRIKVVRSDGGGEYVSPYAEFCVKKRIHHEFTSPYSPQ